MVRLYADRELQEPLGEIHLGTIEVGTSHQFIVYAHNPTLATIVDIIIKFEPNYKGLEVVSVPQNIGAGKTGRIIVEWSPPMTLREALETRIRIEYSELYLAR